MDEEEAIIQYGFVPIPSMTKTAVSEEKRLTSNLYRNAKAAKETEADMRFDK